MWGRLSVDRNILPPKSCSVLHHFAIFPKIGYNTRDMNITDISIIYQDHHLLIVNKPAGVVIHPTYKHVDDTLWDALLIYLSQQGGDDWQPPDLLDEPEW